MIRLDGVTKQYESGAVAVDHLTLDVPEGEICVLVGPSGCGKTTTLRMINRLIEPTSGRIFIDGDDVTHVDPVQLRRRIGYVIQHVGLFPHQTVGDNIATVPKLLGWDRGRVVGPGRRAARPRRASTRSTATATPTSCRAGSGSGSAWPGPSAPTPRSC